MDVELTVDVIPNKRIGDPRVETATDIITMGLDVSLDDAFKEATSDMASWLELPGSKKTTSLLLQRLHIAAEAGFQSGSVLREHFKKSVGVSPVAWRRSFGSSNFADSN